MKSDFLICKVECLLNLKSSFVAIINIYLPTKCMTNFCLYLNAYF